MITYTYRYKRIINWFKNHPEIKDKEKCELHHINPKSCGGNDSKENLVHLPVRWHYIVHCWLPLVYAEQNKICEYHKMLYAWNRFQNYRSSFREALQFIKEDSLIYKQLRNSYIQLLKEVQSNKIKGSNNGRYKTHWYKDPNDKTKSKVIKEGDLIPEGWVKGRWVTEEQVQKLKQNLPKKHWYYNPNIHKQLFISLSDQDEEKLIADGWIKNVRTEFGLKKKNHIKIKTCKKWSEKDLPKLREMYLWYIEHNKNFKGMCEKFGYDKGEANFTYLIRKYIPEIYQFDTRKYSKPRPKHRGPYKKRK